MQLRFDPGDKVEANKIGLVQELKSWVGNAAEHAGNLGQIQPGQAARNVPGGQPAEHHRIDRPAGEDVPVYGAEIPDVYKGKANPPTMAQITISGHMHDTRIGSRRRGAGSRANIWTATPAKLLDTPNRRNAQTHSGQEFETTALALDGAQAGTYYGSVRWGWRTGGNPNAIELVPLSVVTQGAPSPTFMAAAQQWNAVETGPSAIQVPTNAVPVRVSVQYASKPGEDVFVVGNLPDLGDWNPDRAMPLSFRNGQEWEAVINVNGSQLPKQVEYKYLVKRQGQVRWEEGQNHRRQVAAGGPAPVFQDAWHEAHM
jgi:hypothetical protein